ncbi:MAG: ATP-binding cassette domain-containing protein [Clostridium sp.]|nr:MAG: ATP-binding cassette domain-containing protein [Clostridium sp.]
MQIIVKNISKKSLKKVTVLNNVNMTFESGKKYGLVGRNGSGKSVFLKKYYVRFISLILEKYYLII